MRFPWSACIITMCVKKIPKIVEVSSDNDSNRSIKNGNNDENQKFILNTHSNNTRTPRKSHKHGLIQYNNTHNI